MAVKFEAAPGLPTWIRERMPYERRAARIDGERMTFVDHGPRDGTPVLMVHGNPTWSFLWRKVIARLEGTGLRLVAPDLFGFGTSDKPRRPRDHQLDRHVDAVARLAEALELDPFVAVGQDWGGPIACGAAARLSKRVGGLVLGNTAVLTPARPFRSKAFHRFSHLPLVSDAVFRGLLFPVPVMWQVQGDRRSIGPVETAAYAWPFLDPRDRAGALGMARMVPDAERHPSTAPMDRIGAFVESFEGPAALVWGRRDPILGRGLKRHRAALPQASVRESEAGHFSQEEIPALWAEAIAEVARASTAPS